MIISWVNGPWLFCGRVVLVNQNPFARLSWHSKGASINRLLAKIFLVLLICGLLFSMYCFSQGLIMEGLYIYPLLITIYVVMEFGGKGKE